MFTDNQPLSEPFTSTLKKKVEQFSNSQSIIIFDEDDNEPNPDLISPTLLSEIIGLSLDAVSELSTEISSFGNDRGFGS